MNKKAFAFFGLLVFAIFLTVGIHTALAGDYRITIRDMLSAVDPVFSQYTQQMGSDLQRAGYNLDSYYSFSELKTISQNMAQSNGGYWVEFNGWFAGVNSYVDLEQEVTSNYGDIECTYHVKKLFCDSYGYDVCSQTCEDRSSCIDCCIKGAADPDEEWDEGDEDRCIRLCDKLSPVDAVGNNGYDSPVDR